MNLYWPVYKTIEKEVISLSGIIHFSDDQLQVYSSYIADLIVRCAVEIESISKAMYHQLGGLDPEDRELYFDTDCLKLLNDSWKLDKKIITITAPSMYFHEKKLRPLNKSGKRGSSGAKWKRAYQALKHDRYDSLKQGNVENLLNALSALFILNIYYADDNYDAGVIGFGALNLESQYKSEIFEPTGVSACNIQFKENADDSCIVWGKEDDLESAVYIGKYSDEDFKEHHYDWCVSNKWTHKRFEDNEKIRSYVEKHPYARELDVREVCFAAGGENLWREIAVGASGFAYSKIQVKLNKGGRVYPSISKPDDNELEAEIAKRLSDIIRFKYIL